MPSLLALKTNKIALWYAVAYVIFYRNSVEEGLVFTPEDCMYSSAVNYAGEKGMLAVELVFSYLLRSEGTDKYPHHLGAYKCKDKA